MRAAGFTFWLLAIVHVSAAEPGAAASASSHYLYAVNQSSGDRGSISVYDIDRHHRLIKTIGPVSNVEYVLGIAVSAATGRLYVAYQASNDGMIYCLNVYDSEILWNRIVSPGVDRLAINPDGQLLYVPTGESNTSDYINVVDASTGEVVRKIHSSKRSHDTLFPLAGPIFQETKADDGSGRYLYLINPITYAISSIGPFGDVLGPYSVDGRSRYVVSNVTHLWGMQVADLKTGQIVTANIPDPPPSKEWLLPHGIAWRPDEKEVWQNGGENDTHVYIWNMSHPMAPTLEQRLELRSGPGPHWITFDIDGHYAYIAPAKNSEYPTEIFDARTHLPVGTIASSEDMLEIDYADGKVSRVGDQYGIGRVGSRLP